MVVLSESKCQIYVESNFKYSIYNPVFFYLDDGNLIECLFNCKKDDQIMVAIKNNHVLEALILELRRAGIVEIKMLSLYSMDRMIPFIDEHGELSRVVKKLKIDNPFLVHIETHITDLCNLNCKGCNNFSPFFKEDRVNDGMFESDLSKLARLFNIDRLFLLGGEPLLAEKRCIKMLEIAKELLPETEIRLLTNGLLLTNVEESLLDTLAQLGIVVQISLYIPTLKKIKEIKNILISKNIRFVIGERVDYFFKHWSNVPENNAITNNQLCGSAGCHFFRDGKIYKCPDAALIKYLPSEVFALKNDEGIVIDDITDAKKMQEKILNETNLCKYCTIKRGQWIPWNQTRGNVEEKDWLVDNKIEWDRKKQTLIGLYLNEKGINPKDYTIVMWGCGKLFTKVNEEIHDYIHIDYVVDRKADYWDKQVGGITCISPFELGKMRNVFCLICIEREKDVFDVIGELTKIAGIKFDHIRNLLSRLNN